MAKLANRNGRKWWRAGSIFFLGGGLGISLICLAQNDSSLREVYQQTLQAQSTGKLSSAQTEAILEEIKNLDAQIQEVAAVTNIAERSYQRNRDDLSKAGKAAAEKKVDQLKEQVKLTKTEAAEYASLLLQNTIGHKSTAKTDFLAAKSRQSFTLAKELQSLVTDPNQRQWGSNFYKVTAETASQMKKDFSRPDALRNVVNFYKEDPTVRAQARKTVDFVLGKRTAYYLLDGTSEQRKAALKRYGQRLLDDITFNHGQYGQIDKKTAQIATDEQVLTKQAAHENSWKDWLSSDSPAAQKAKDAMASLAALKSLVGKKVSAAAAATSKNMQDWYQSWQGLSKEEFKKLSQEKMELLKATYEQTKENIKNQHLASVQQVVAAIDEAKNLADDSREGAEKLAHQLKISTQDAAQILKRHKDYLFRRLSLALEDAKVELGMQKDTLLNFPRELKDEAYRQAKGYEDLREKQSEVLGEYYAQYYPLWLSDRLQLIKDAGISGMAQKLWDATEDKLHLREHLSSLLASTLPAAGNGDSETLLLSMMNERLCDQVIQAIKAARSEACWERLLRLSVPQAGEIISPQISEANRQVSCPRRPMGLDEDFKKTLEDDPQAENLLGVLGINCTAPDREKRFCAIQEILQTDIDLQRPLGTLERWATKISQMVKPTVLQKIAKTIPTSFENACGVQISCANVDLPTWHDAINQDLGPNAKTGIIEEEDQVGAPVIRH